MVEEGIRSDGRWTRLRRRKGRKKVDEDVMKVRKEVDEAVMR